MSISTPMPSVEAEAVAATRKRWALDTLGHAAAEHRRTARALALVIEQARRHDCTAQDIAEILGGYR